VLVVREPDGYRHGAVAMNLALVLGNFVKAHELGRLLAMAPDLAVEVLSPDDRPGEVLEKVGDWLNAGVRLVWVVDPRRNAARVYRSDGSETHLAAGDTLDGEDVLPGFSCRLADVLEPPGRTRVAF
jgi:Uma2 family endonuclease